MVTGEVRDRRSGVEQVRQVLASIGSPAPVIGFVAHDPAGAGGLWAGELTRRFAGSELVRSVRATAESVLAGWPDLLPPNADGPRWGRRRRPRWRRRPRTRCCCSAESAGPVMEGTTVMTDTPVDYQLVTTLQGRVADEMTRAKQLREARGERELSDSDERQLAFSVITAVVQRHLASVLAAGGELPVDAGYDLRLIMAVDAAMFEAAEFQTWSPTG